MKKILRRIFLGILSVVIIAVAATCAYLFNPGGKIETVRPTVTDTKGNAYLAVYGEAGETYAAVTDTNGKIYAAEIDQNGNIGNTVASIDDKVSLEEIPKNYDGPQINETVGSNSYQGSANVVDATTVPQTQPTTQNTTTTEKPSSKEEPTKKPSSKQDTTKPTAVSTTQPPASVYRIEKYQKIFASETYYMEFTTNDDELGDTPIIAAAKNGNILIETSVEGIACKMLYVADTDTTYIILDNWRKYSKLPKEMLGDDLDMSELNMASNFATDISNKKVTVKTVEINGKLLTCESYYTEKGSLMEYYFDGDTLVRLDSTDTDGQLSSTYISKLTTDVPDSTFQIPDGYGYLNLDWLSMLT